MADTLTFTKEEIDEIRKLRSDFDELISDFGRFSIRKTEIMQAIASEEDALNANLASIKKAEEAYSDKILKKYGEGTFDIETGTFSPKGN